LCLGILFGGRFTGGQYNPAISVALWLINENPLSTLPYYLAGQFGGAFFGAYLCWVILDLVSSPYFEVTGRVDVFEAFLGETLGTFILTHFVLC
jgi:glycerol uptake facilitator protein